MPTWNTLVDEFNATPVEGRSALMTERLRECVAKIAAHRSSNVIYYASGFLQKPGAPPFTTQITLEDINGFMAGIHGLKTKKPLLQPRAAWRKQRRASLSTSEAVRSRGPSTLWHDDRPVGGSDHHGPPKPASASAWTVLVPTYAMSAGTMIGLSADRIIMGRQSQLALPRPDDAISRTLPIPKGGPAALLVSSSSTGGLRAKPSRCARTRCPCPSTQTENPDSRKAHSLARDH